MKRTAENQYSAEPKSILKDGRKKGWFWEHNAIFDSGLSAHAMLVRLYLARCANGDRQAWPSLKTIAKYCKISKPTVIKAIKELEENGWLGKILRKRPNQEYETTIYVLNDPPECSGNKMEGGGKADLPPVKNETGYVGGVVKDVYQVVNQADNVVNQVDPNNTQIIIPRYKEKDKLFASSLCEDANNSASALRASCAAAGSTSLEKETNNSDSHPQAGAADAAGEKSGPEDQGSAKNGESPTNKELIAELVKEYRAVEGVMETRGDYAFIGALYNRYGYDCLLEAIHELALATAVQEIGKPLLYLKSVVQAIATRISDQKTNDKKITRSPKQAKEKTGASNWAAIEDKAKKRELIKSLYQN